MIKVSVDYLLKEVDKLYDNNMNLTDNAEIEKFCDHVTCFIESCGYTTDDYVRLIMGFETNKFAN